MAQLQKDAETILIKKRRAVFFDEVTRKKIDRHLSDINDTISDEDIRNVITDIRSGSTDNHRAYVYPEYGARLPE